MSDETTADVSKEQTQPQPVQVYEGLWKTRGGKIRRVTPTPEDDARAVSFPWWDGARTWRIDGRFYADSESPHDLVEYFGPFEPEPQPVRVREGRWLTRGGDIRDVTPTPEHDGRAQMFPWSDGSWQVWAADGRYYPDTANPLDLMQYLGPIKPETTAQAKTEEQPDEPQPDAAALAEQLQLARNQCADQAVLIATLRAETEWQKGRMAFLETLNAGNAAAITDYKAKAERLQGLVDTALRELDAVKAELAAVAADRQRLQIELDAAQQVPAAIADRFEEGWNQGTARAVETVLEWLEPIRLVDSAYLANATMQHLPQIMRHLTGLDSQAID